MIRTCGLESNGGVFEGSKEIMKMVKAIAVHLLFSVGNNLGRGIENTIIKFVFGDINSDKVVKWVLTHFKPPFLLLLKFRPQLCLPIDSGFGAKSTYRSLWDGGQTPYEAFKLRKNGVLCPISFTSLTNIIYFINIKYNKLIYRRRRDE